MFDGGIAPLCCNYLTESLFVLRGLLNLYKFISSSSSSSTTKTSSGKINSQSLDRCDSPAKLSPQLLKLNIFDQFSHWIYHVLPTHPFHTPCTNQPIFLLNWIMVRKLLVYKNFGPPGPSHPTQPSWGNLWPQGEAADERLNTSLQSCLPPSQQHQYKVTSLSRYRKSTNMKIKESTIWEHGCSPTCALPLFVLLMFSAAVAAYISKGLLA